MNEAGLIFTGEYMSRNGRLQVATAPVGDWLINEITRFPPMFSTDPINVCYEIALKTPDHLMLAGCCYPDEVFECPEWGDMGKHWASFCEERLQCAIDLCLALTRGCLT
jgi:hypothetical protein